MGAVGSEAQKLVWEGTIPLEIRLHESEITTYPPPPPALILGPRLGYLPLLAQQVKPYFSDTLPPGADTVWFEYKGLPLKWHIPIGVLFDLLCGEPERPWNLTVHFRGYPTDLLSPCEDEDSVKWSFINSLKEHRLDIQNQLVDSVIVAFKLRSKMIEYKPGLGFTGLPKPEAQARPMLGKIESFLRISSKLKLGIVGEEGYSTMTSCSIVSRQTRQTTGDVDTPGPNRTGRIPVRLYVRSVGDDVDDFGDITPVDNWDEISYVNRPLEFHDEDGKLLTLYDALKSVLPELFEVEPSIAQESSRMDIEESRTTETTSNPQDLENAINSRCKETKETPDKCQSQCFPYRKTEIKLVRIQGIEPKLVIPFAWVVKNLTNPDHFLHISVFVNASRDQPT
ncbi:hypothetical protein Syun_027883 [Stephania yunnanensis]|uniref:Autophagy protein 5 n=1 Tax=Stephania yunnanensis TaxID=152371 RepID=A0AAP0ELI2_9MAGN